MWNKQNDVWIWKAQTIQIGNLAHFISNPVTKLNRIKLTLYRRDADANHLTATSGRLRTDFHVFNAFWETMPPLDSQETHHMMCGWLNQVSKLFLDKSREIRLAVHYTCLAQYNRTFTQHTGLMISAIQTSETILQKSVKIKLPCSFDLITKHNTKKIKNKARSLSRVSSPPTCTTLYP